MNKLTNMLIEAGLKYKARTIASNKPFINRS